MSENNMLDKDFKDIINNIKQEIQNTQYKVAIESNINLLSMYFKLGKILNDNYEYGNKFIDEVSKDLKSEFPNSTGFSVRNLKYMKKFYLEYKDDEVVQQLVAQVPWGHNIVLMEKIKELGFYVTAIDETLKKEQDNPTIGLLLCRDKDRLTVDYSLKSINVPIGVSSFEIEKYIPKDILEKLPTEEDLNLHIDIKDEEDNEG